MSNYILVCLFCLTVTFFKSQTTLQHKPINLEQTSYFV